MKNGLLNVYSVRVVYKIENKKFTFCACGKVRIVLRYIMFINNKTLNQTIIV